MKEKFLDLISQVNNLEFSVESIVELGAIKLEAERVAKSIVDKKLKKFCSTELEEIRTDEFPQLFSGKDQISFNSAKSELIQVLRDCANGKLNSI